MNPAENVPAAVEYHCKAPTTFQIFFIILLGISGMIGTFQFMLYDLQMTGYKKELWAVKDLTGNTGIEQNVAVDSITVIYHPDMATRRAGLKTGGLPAKTNKNPSIAATSANTLDYHHLYFAYNSVFLVWIAIFSIMVGCSLSLLPVIWITIVDIIKVFSLNNVQKIPAILTTVLIGGLIYLSQNISYLTKPSLLLEKFRILLKDPTLLDIFIVLSIAVALTAIAGQLFINQAIDKLPDNSKSLDRDETNKIADKFELLRNRLKFFLVIDAALIVLSILNTDSFRRAIISEISVNMDIVPRNYVYLYGVLFTFFLAVVYLPVYYRLRYKGEMMLKEISQDVPESYNSAVINVLNIKETPIESLKLVFTILAPVLTSMVPGLLNI